MPHVAPPEPEAPRRLPDDETQQLVLQTVATHAESLLRTAERHSLCADDAHDAYQRGLEIFMRRAATLDPDYVDRWLHVVVKREAMAVRRGRSEFVAADDLDYETHKSLDAPDPAERVLSSDRSARAAEALRRLKPQELRAMWLKALGHSYDEISVATGFSRTKVNRCLAEGRKSFLERYAGLEAGEECQMWQPVISAMVDGEATATQVAELRPHLRNCPGCRATLKGLHESERSLAAVLPVGLVTAGLKFGGLLERLMPVAGAGADQATAAGGAGILGIGGAKLIGLLAAGAAATAGSGLVVAHEHHRAGHPASHHVTAVKTAADRTPATSPHLAPATHATKVAQAAVVRHASPKTRKTTSVSHGAASSTSTHTRRAEFAPAGGEVPPPAPPAHAAVTPKPAPTKPVAPAPTTSPASADATSGEFAPQP